MVVLSPETIIELFGLSIDDVDCSGLKLHLDKVFVFKGKGVLAVNSRKLAEVEEAKTENNVYHLAPGAYRIRYKEIVRVPSNAIALAIPRSTLIRNGTTIYTAVWDPGYEGRGEGLLTVFNPNGVDIEKGAQIAQLIFIKLDKETKFVYRGLYQKENI
ncbi:deoxyuridine 5'-triphosphate nucleotidohydrolase [Ignisphaera sp. 4213-co]|uniref:Deoxyuridine 5'-triphosphate nucleotidohydrolase n=1 Tax=Ignisphaera cupida TaxID=3050454 RepID=A0ABD4Z8Z8_9CREN|nr:deoxyuridine 5'-triphosphate nucleotidohydrolase [Ignisphaera sp. 4213-co]MDK6029179.1 deoxyuridine 5'-triphosphate nucleotidohydrolase [Ignisphaera sp. 4213-co]